MTDRDTKSILAKCDSYGFINSDVVKMLCADNLRLRIVATDLNAYRTDQSYACPWCHVDDDTHPRQKHKDDCYGFTPDGQVR